MVSVFVWQFIRRSEEHKNTTVTALCWDEEETRLFIGDVKGVVSVVHIPQAGKVILKWSLFFHSPVYSAE